MEKPIVFVIGATGSVGSATVTALSSKYADKLDIRAGVRNLDKADKLKALAGVTVVQAEMGTKEKLVETFKGVDVLYIVTPGAENRAQLTIATAEAGMTAGVKHLVVVSIPPADERSDIIFGRQFGEIEKDIKKLGVPYTILRLPMFMENHLQLVGTIKGQSSIFLPIDPTNVIAAVAASDAGKFAAAILLNPSKHVNMVYNVISDHYTYNDLAAAFSEALGKEIKYVKITFEELKQIVVAAGVAEWQAKAMIELLKLVDDASPHITLLNNSDANVFTNVTGDQPTSIKTWISQMAPAFM